MARVILKKNEKVLGRLKVETPEGLWIDKFIALKSKSYSFIENEETHRKIKGVSKVASKKITFEEYYSCLMNYDVENPIKHTILSIQTDFHEIYLSKIIKNYSSSADSKSYFLNNNENVQFGYFQ